MRIDRRSFLRMAAGAGLVVAAPPTGFANPGGGPWRGPFWVTLHASGGWDPTLLCDPKGRLSETQTDPVNNYRRDEIVQVGNFQLAPVEGIPAFFERWGSRVLAINGIDTGTNSHDTGVRHVWSGSFDLDMPALSALVAAASPAQPPALAFLSYGGYDATAQVIAPTRIPGVDAISELASPHLVDINSASSSPLTARGLEALREARRARMERLSDHATLPRRQRSLGVLYDAQGAENELVGLTQFLPESIDNSQNPLLRQAQVACAAFRSGLSVSANLSIGGFDTHGNHDQSHIPRLQQLIEGLDFLLAEAERQGIIDQLYVVVGSDFARTPWYNETRGKDHWSITSMLVMGPGIRGGRVIGGTDDGQRVRTVDPTTLAFSESGVRITPGAVHASLRELAGIQESAVARQFRVAAPRVALFS